MFLLLLIIFPVISYFIFNKYKNEVNELNGIPKFIGLIGLLLIIIIILSDIYNRNEEYLMLNMFWYFGVFLYFYSIVSRLQFNNIKKLIFKETSFSDKIIKIFFLIIIYIFFISIRQNYLVIDKLDIFQSSGFNLINLISFYFISILFCGIFYEIIDVFKNRFIYNEFLKNDYRIKLKNELKNELKKEILKELNNK